jgi:hypothetical protein
VEHPCHQCGTPIEDGVPFCPKCNAPQIHVNLSPETQTIGSGAPSAATSLEDIAGSRPGIPWKHMRLRALPIATALALLMISAPQYFWLWMPLMGSAVVWLHRIRTSETVSSRAGLRIGVFTGAVAFAIWSAVLISAVVYDRMVLHQTDRVTEGLRLSLQQYAEASPDPQIRQKAAEILSRPALMTTYLIISLFIFFLLFLSLCGAGGALGAALGGLRSP